MTLVALSRQPSARRQKRCTAKAFVTVTYWWAMGGERGTARPEAAAGLLAAARSKDHCLDIGKRRRLVRYVSVLDSGTGQC